MKKSFFYILVCVLILSLAMPVDSNSVMAETKEPPAPTPNIPDWKRFETIPEGFEPDLTSEGTPYLPNRRDVTWERRNKIARIHTPKPRGYCLHQAAGAELDCGTVTDVPKTECELWSHSTALMVLGGRTTNWLITTT